MSNPANHGSGLLFKNFRKQKPNHPDYIGTAEIDGKKLEISAWIKPLKNGKGKFMSLSYSEPRERGNAAGLPTAEQPASTEAPQQPTTEQQEGDGILV
ncbi:MAG: hypothetical protein WCH99_04135 [Verrucomicrobiota bacterium]